MQARLHAIRYDSGRGAFEGRLDVERDGRVLRYAVRLEAPETAPRDWVEAGLTRQGLRMSTAEGPRAPRAPGFGQALASAFSGVAAAFRPRSSVPVRTDGPGRPQARLR